VIEIYQTDSQFPTAIQEWGCFFLVILKKLSLLYRPDIWNYGEIVRIYEQEEINHDLKSDLTVSTAQGICNDVAGIGRVHYLGAAGPDFQTGAGLPSIGVRSEFAALEYRRPEVDFSHFVLEDPFYDPYSAEGSLSVKLGKVIGKRIFQCLALGSPSAVENERTG
jgi:hypothetical protein